MKPTVSRSDGDGGLRIFFAALLALVSAIGPLSTLAGTGYSINPPIPGSFDPEKDPRDPQPLTMFAVDSLPGLNHAGILFRYKTEYDSTTGYYVARRYLFNEEYGRPLVFSPEDYRDWRIERDQRHALQKVFYDEIVTPAVVIGAGAIEIQVPFKIKSKTFRKIFGGDRVGLRVTGNINIDGGLRREKSDQVITTRSDQANYNFKIDQTQQFHIVGKVGDKVSVEIDQDSERIFDFENAVKLEYQGDEDEIIQSIEAGNISLSLPGTQLATLSGANKGLFGFKTLSKIGPLSFTAIASLQKGEKNKKTYTGGAETQTFPLDDKAFVRNQYFFLDLDYRTAYPRFASDYSRLPVPASRKVEQIEVYRSVYNRAGDNETYYDGWVLSQPPENVNSLSQQEIATLIAQYDDDVELQSDNDADKGLFRKLVQGEDYIFQPNLGYIRLAFGAREEMIAVAYRLTDGTTIGVLEPNGTKIILKLIKPGDPTPTDETWDLSWKHVYWVGTTDLDPADFQFKIIRNDINRRETNEQGKTWLELFGLDRRNDDGASTPDGKVDPVFVKYAFGEVHFPDLRPFDPAGYELGGELQVAEIDTGLYNPNIYDIDEDSNIPIETNFLLQANYSNTSATISLGINVLEGSEDVYLNGARLEKNKDYIIDYLSGQVTILNDAAFAPGANLEINYESGEIFQLDRRTMLGLRLEYALWEDSFIGGTMLHFNEKPLDERVKVGQEPLRNTILDMNARLRFRPYFMTALVNAIPLIETDEESRIEIEGEIAQVFPNPNSLNNESTGDDDGVAYIDDFEGVKRATPLGVMRKGWFPAGHPLRIPRGEFPGSYDDSTDYRGRLIWFNPYRQVAIKEIWPNREVNSKVANSVHVLTLEYDPSVNNHRSGHVEPQKTWNGVMRWLSQGFHNQSNTKFIDIWMKWSGGGPDATLFVDMGEISEDVIPNGELDTEDESLFGDDNIGNGILDEGEDTGVDGIRGPDPLWRLGPGRSDDPWLVDEQGYDYTSGQFDWWDVNDDGFHNPGEPFSSDNWSYARGDYEFINGIEGNESDEGGRFPDTEDLDRNNALTRANRFFRYRFRLTNPADSIQYIRGGQDNEDGWRLIRIPFNEPFEEIGQPDPTKIKFIRVWMTGFSAYSLMHIAQFELVGNEWVEDPVIDPVSGDSTVYVTGATINTYDNPEDYLPPPGVEGEIDPITDIRTKEQSLLIKVLNLPTAATGQLTKYLMAPQDLREYESLKMFVHGGGRNPEALAGRHLEMFLRFGTGLRGANEGYYEYSQRLNPGWAGNEIFIDLDRLTRLKKKAEQQGSNAAYEVLPNGDVLKVIGKPSIGAVNVYAVGLRNFGLPIDKEDNLEMWVDELRLSGIRKETGTALRSSVSADFADLLNLRVGVDQRDADFHQVDRRSGSAQSTLNTNLSGTLNVQKFIDPKHGISIPLRGTVTNNLSIPKYTSGSGDIRTESIVEEGELNIWDRYADKGFSLGHLDDNYLFDDFGNVIVDSVSGIPLQDLEAWGIDTLFTTNLQYTWGMGFSKNRASSSWPVKYTLDNISIQWDHSQRYNSSLQYQYQKSFTNHGNLSYTLPFARTDVSILRWAEHIPLLGKLSDTRFNFLPGSISGSLDGSETRTSAKYRSALERPTYQLNLTRAYSTSYSPFNAMNFSYNYSARAQYAREDSTRQMIFWLDQPEYVKLKTFAPGTLSDEIIAATQQTLRALSAEGAAIADSADNMLAAGYSGQEVVDYIFAAIDGDPLLAAEDIRRPWKFVEAIDPRYDRTFWTISRMPFADTQKTQRISGNYSPTLFSWLGTDFSYGTNYNWTWNAYAYSGRTVSSNSTLGANFVLRIRQLIPREDRGRKDRDRRRDVPGAEGFGRDTGNASGTGGESETEDEEQSKEDERGAVDQPNPLQVLFFLGRRLQDLRFDYTQNLSFVNPTVEDGNASWEYQFGLTGNPGLGTVPGYITFPTSQRSDDYRFRSGIDWTTRLNSGFDYSIRLSRSTGAQVVGSTSRSAFYIYVSPEEGVRVLEIPNWTLRWSGLEQFGPLKSIAQSISFDHAYSGNYSEDWNEVVAPDGSGVEKAINRRSFQKGFNPLGGFTITWKYGISSTIKYNWSQTIGEDPFNESRSRDTKDGISLTARYTKKSGLRIPIPIWPFKNRRFKNETTFSLTYDRSSTLKETAREGLDFKLITEQLSWSLTPSVDYSFSRSVTGGARYKYGVTSSSMNTTSYQEFGINVNIAIRG